MSKWVLKALLQKTISFLPGKHRINYLFQRYITKGVQLSEGYFSDRMIHFRQHLHFQHKYLTIPAEQLQVLELGTGWYPVIPIAWFLAGAEKTYTVDISELTDREKLLATLRYFLRWESTGQLQTYLQAKPERLAQLKKLVEQGESMTFADLLAELRIVYLVEDARRLPLASHSIDLITSNNTFEHIYPDILRAILQEFRRLLKPGGLMSHFIDMSDHFAHLDQQITIYNFLQFSEQAWAWIDNSIQPQNRWRISQYRALYRALGLPVTEEHNRPGQPEVVQQLTLAAPFRDLPVEEVAISHGYVVSHLPGMP